MTRSLFCFACAEIGGGNWVLLKLAEELSAQGQHVEMYFWDDRKSIEWNCPGVSISSARNIEAAVGADFDFVYFAIAFLVPLALPHIGNAQAVLVCQGYESFCYGDTYEDALNDSVGLASVMQLPISIISTSRSIQTLVKERTGRDSLYVPVGIERTNFRFNPALWTDSPKRILLVGNYLLPWKGMKDGFAAIDLLSRELSVQLVLVTQASSGRHLFDQYDYASEIHHRPNLKDVATIMSTCHVYCCTSWYEGLGLPKLEAFSSGLPVVSTRDYGVSEFGVDGVNILLAEPNNPRDLYEKLKRILTEEGLANKLRTAALETVEQYDWSNATPAFVQAQCDILANPIASDMVTTQAMRSLCDQLEAAGMYTPSDTYATIRMLYKRFHELCTQLIEQEIEVAECVAGLSEVGNELASYLNNPDAQYYKAFQARYDACRLLLSLKDEPKFVDYVKAIHTAH